MHDHEIRGGELPGGLIQAVRGVGRGVSEDQFLITAWAKVKFSHLLRMRQHYPDGPRSMAQSGHAVIHDSLGMQEETLHLQSGEGAGAKEHDREELILGQPGQELFESFLHSCPRDDRFRPVSKPGDKPLLAVVRCQGGDLRGPLVVQCAKLHDACTFTDPRGHLGD